MKPNGFLAIWCDIGAEDLQDYRDWLTREHIADRTFSSGFLGVRLFEALDDPRSHFILYATDGPEVLEGAPYRAILDNPSPWTRAIMPRFGPFDRAAGVQTLKLGNGFGSHVMVARLWTGALAPDPAQMTAAFSGYLDLPGIVSLRLCAVDKSSTDIDSAEKTMREGGEGGEGSFQLLLCIEAMGEAAVQGAEAAVAATLANAIPTLARFDISSRRMIYGEAPHEGATLAEKQTRRQ